MPKPGRILLAKITLVSLMIPMHFSLGPLAMNASRLLFLVITVPLFVRLIAGAYGRLVAADFMIVLFTLWSLASIAVNNSSVFVSFGGSQALMLLGAYIAARASIRTPEDFYSLIRFMVLAMMILLPFAVIESTTNRALLQEFFERLPGAHAASPHNPGKRLGLHRARTVFAVSIHYGLYASMVLTLVFIGLSKALSLTKRVMLSTLCFVSCILAVSSGPLLGMLIQIGLITWGIMTRRMRGGYWLLLGLGVVLYAVLEVLSDRPAIIAVLSRIAFNADTVQARVTLFEGGMVEIARAPFLGIGFNPWISLPPWMTGSVDNFWLLTTVAFGLPALVFLLGAIMISVLRLCMRQIEAGSEFAMMRKAWAICMVGTTLTLGTVAVWGTAYSLVIFLFASGLWMLNYTPQAPSEEDPAQQEPETGRASRSRYTRFGPQSAGLARVEGRPIARQRAQQDARQDARPGARPVVRSGPETSV